MRNTKTGYDPVAVARNYVMIPHSRLPDGFSYWEICDLEDGHTVAHVAARRGDLPHDFDRWELADDDGWTVRDEAVRAGMPPGKINVK